MGIKIFLDDIREAPKGWVKVTTARQAIEYLKYYPVDEISLDHDLGPRKHQTGYDVLLWLEELVLEGNEFGQPNPNTLPKIHIHTSNPVARKRMEQVLEKILSKCRE